jgi:SnoaL-like protein
MEESPELERLTLRFYQAIGRGDAGLVRELTSSQRGVLGIGTDPNEWWEGGGAIAEHVKGQLKALGGELNVVHAAPHAYQEGSVGWISDRAAALLLENGTEVPFRFTAVFHKEDGDWKMVQFHTSIGILNESAVGKALPT